jgi:hypothetical protein
MQELTWPPSEPELKLFDDSLRCNICYEFYIGPVTLGCGHTCARLWRALCAPRLCAAAVLLAATRRPRTPRPS